MRQSPWSTISSASPIVSRQRLASSPPFRLPQILFDRVEVGGVGRETFDDQPLALLLDEALHRPAAVGGKSVPDQGDLVAVEVAVEFTEEVHQ